MQHRRSDYDVTNTVQVSSPQAVCDAVCELFAHTSDEPPVTTLRQAFTDFQRLFTGQFPGYLGCDTVYHDMQHSLDGTLATARLIVGHDRSQPDTERFGMQLGLLGVVITLFHDAGYIRRTEEAERHGAEFTASHVSRSAQFLAGYLPGLGLGEYADTAARIVHFTGYEVQFEQIETADPRLRRLGHLIGTGDLIAQLADRCYLEKCRDRLYPELALGSLADPRPTQTQYQSGLDVLRQTPRFIDELRRSRLDGAFASSYRHLEALFDGSNPYLDAIERNERYLREALQTGRWPHLRRDPPCFTSQSDPVQTIHQRLAQRRRQTGEDS